MCGQEWAFISVIFGLILCAIGYTFGRRTSPEPPKPSQEPIVQWIDRRTGKWVVGYPSTKQVCQAAEDEYEAWKKKQQS